MKLTTKLEHVFETKESEKLLDGMEFSFELPSEKKKKTNIISEVKKVTKQGKKKKDVSIGLF